MMKQRQLPEPALKYMRTAEESRDVFLSWRRQDKAFFAAGACHILAHMFLSLHAGEGFELIYLRPTTGQPGNHMYASDGTWAFDFNGWSHEADLIAANSHYAARHYPGWDYERIVIAEGLPEHLKHSSHLRPPEYFPELPWQRAYNYIRQFPATPLSGSPRKRTMVGS